MFHIFYLLVPLNLSIMRRRNHGKKFSVETTNNQKQKERYKIQGLANLLYTKLNMNSNYFHYFKFTNFIKRTVFTLIMLGLFIFISTKHVSYLVSLVVFLTLFILKEIISIARTQQGYVCHIGIVITFSLVIYNYYLFDALTLIYPSMYNIFLAFKKVYFYIYLICLIFFVCSFKPGKLKKQFSLFSLIHLASYLVGNCCRSAIKNVGVGKFWLFFPSTLVICNDIFAYIVGKLIGHTPLFRLSPKKTVEGYIGGFIFTLIYGYIFIYLQLKYTPFNDLYNEEIRRVLTFIFFNYKWHIPYIYLHGLSFILMASFVAPFSGFFASAFKRTYGKKDFGNSIPGHGGLTDRFDCQCIMIFFTQVYLKSILRTNEQALESYFHHITNSFNNNDILRLINMLNNHINLIIEE